MALTRWTHHPYSCHLRLFARPTPGNIDLPPYPCGSRSRKERQAGRRLWTYQLIISGTKTSAADRQATSIKTQKTPCTAVGVTKVTRYRFKRRSNGFHSPGTRLSSAGTPITRGTLRFPWYDIMYMYVCSTQMMLVRVLTKDGEHLCTHLFSNGRFNV